MKPLSILLLLITSTAYGQSICVMETRLVPKKVVETHIEMRPVEVRSERTVYVEETRAVEYVPKRTTSRQQVIDWNIACIPPAVEHLLQCRAEGGSGCLIGAVGVWAQCQFLGQTNSGMRAGRIGPLKRIRAAQQIVRSARQQTVNQRQPVRNLARRVFNGPQMSHGLGGH